ncbi:MAG: hypothetical protein IJZ47_02395 [Oscillospiraceae bacterium]|nr:hypothetical protein [Oscillospiraceae bacterium]
MNKEQILEMSRKENKEQDLYELEISSKATRVSSLICVIICAVLYVAEIMVCGNQNYGLWTIIAAFIAGTFLYTGIKLKNKVKIAVGILWTVIAVIAIVAAIVNLFTTSTIL